ncbi:uncharacterized protein [Mytilus edulis]|uniref:uncharacterized protein n=1 Tax=Mytilus edulis TaxID=6550 RepID=UPI0039EFD17F
MLGAYYIKEDVLVLHYLFSICNSLQGFFIFLFHCIFCNQVGQGYLQCMRKRRESRTLSSTDSINISYQRRLNQLKIYPDKHIPHFPNEEFIKPSDNREEPFPDYPKETTQNVENSIYNFNRLARTVYYDSKYDNRGYSPFDIPK